MHAIRTDSHRMLILKQMLYYQLFMQATPDDPFCYSIGQHLNRSGLAVDNYTDLQVSQVERNPRILAFNNRILLVTARRLYASKPLHVGSENLGFNLNALVYRKRSPLRVAFDLL